MKPSSDSTLFVTGASGRLARLVVEQLLDAGVARGRLIAGTRTPEKIADLAARGAVVRHVDFDRPDELPRAFAGADRILIISTNTLMPVGRRVEQHRAAIEAAVSAGAERIFYTSLVRAETDNPEEAPLALCMDHASTERLLGTCGVPSTSLRNGFYAETLLRRLQACVTLGVVIGPETDTGTSWIRRVDCARAAAGALMADTPPDGPVEITGAEILSPRRMAELTAHACGHPVRFVAKPPKALVDDLMAGGFSHARSAVMMAMEAAMSSGHFAILTDAVQRLSGRAPMSMATFLAESLRPVDASPQGAGGQP